MKVSHVFAAVLVGLAGCSEPHEPDVPVTIEQVPANLVKIANEKLPGIKFDSAYKGKKDGKEIYEIRGKGKDGKTREVEVFADGTLIEIE